MSDSTLGVEVRDQIEVVRFNRPDQLNAMNTPMIGELVAQLERADANHAIKAIVLSGAGRAFMAGADLKEYGEFNARSFREFQRRGRRVYESIEKSRKLVVAAVNGYALGGGFEMVLAADFVVAKQGVKMGLPEVKLGLVPGGGGTQRLSRKVGPNRALELLTSGRFATAEELAAWGLVNQVCTDDPVEAACDFLSPMLEHPLAALSGLKQLGRLAQTVPLSVGLDQEAEVLQSLFESEAGQARIRAFIEKSGGKA